MTNMIKRVKNFWDDQRHGQAINSNIFAPTAALHLFNHLNKVVPNHSLILADFDYFLSSYNTIKGINAPQITNKLQRATEWDTYDSYLVPRGQADICFPSDFKFLQHAYQNITKQPSSVYKNQEFIDMFSMENWARTQNNYNPMREEYINTSFLVTEYSKGQGRVN